MATVTVVVVVVGWPCSWSFSMAALTSSEVSDAPWKAVVSGREELRKSSPVAAEVTGKLCG